MAIDRTKVNPADNEPVNDIELTEQEILNKSLDKRFNILGVEILEFDGTRLRRAGEKPACSYTWTDGFLTQKVAVYTDRTETTTYTWTDGKLTNKETIIT